MTRASFRKCVAILVIGILWVGGAVGAKPLLKAPGDGSMPVFCKSVAADVKIAGQFATTDMHLVYQHASGSDLEVEFVYELPAGAVATYFAYWAGDEKVVGRIVEKQEAAETYRRITAPPRGCDPALVEMIGKNRFSAKIFPVLPYTDLKIQITYVQMLTSDKAGACYSLPVGDLCAADDDLESVSANVSVRADASVAGVSNNYGLPAVKNDGSYVVKLSGFNFRPPKDLNIRVLRREVPLKVSAYSAPCTRGGDGFFALAVVPDHTLTNPKVSVSGAGVYDVVLPQVKSVKAYAPVLVRGRYRGAGAVKVSLEGGSPSGPLKYAGVAELGGKPEAANLASKLWAAGRIEQLGRISKNRARVIKLSLQYTLPSRYTSWLAVPKDVKKNDKEQVRWQRMGGLASSLAKLLVDGKWDTAECRKMRKEYDALTKAAEGNYPGLQDYLWSDLARLAKMIGEGKGNSAQARTLSKRLKSGLGSDFHSCMQSAIDSEVAELNSQIIGELYAVKPDVKRAEQIKKGLKKLGAQYDPAKYGDWRARETAAKLGYEAAKRVAEGRQDAESQDMLRRHETLIKMLAYSDAVGSDNANAGAQQYASDLVSKLINVKYKVQPEAGRVEELNAQLGRLADKYQVDVKKLVAEATARQADQQMYDYVDLVVEGKKDSNAAIEARHAFTAACEESGKDAEQLLKDRAGSQMRWKANDYIETSDKKWAKQLEEIMRRLEPIAGKSTEAIIKEAQAAEKAQTDDWNLYQKTDPMIEALSLELFKNKPNMETVNKIGGQLREIVANRKGEDVAKVYDEVVLHSAVAVGELREQFREAAESGDTEKVARIRNEKSAIVGSLGHQHNSVLYYGHGDPLIAVEAPADAVQVVAVMPDGEIKPLVYSLDRKCWEGRFDIPSYVAEGSYSISVVVLLADGTRNSVVLNYAVDINSPNGDGLIKAGAADATLRIDASSDTARVVALLPWGERVELKNGEGSSRFTANAAVPVDWQSKAYAVTFVLTDIAHNRTSITVDASK